MARQPLPFPQTVRLGWLFGCLLLGVAELPAAPLADLLRDARAADARQDSPAALGLFLQADAAQPNDAFILQKIARQYSDLVTDQPTVDAKKRYAQTALDYSQRAVALNPQDPVNVLSLAVCHGKLATYSDTRAKVKFSRMVREETDRALALNPDYAWAHHVLGRWHGEVARLGVAARIFVRMFYGGMPDASVDEGIRQLRRAIELEPGELEHWVELGFACAAADQREPAQAAWQHALAMPSRGPHDEASKQRARTALPRLAR